MRAFFFSWLPRKKTDSKICFMNLAKDEPEEAQEDDECESVCWSLLGCSEAAARISRAASELGEDVRKLEQRIERDEHLRASSETG